MNYVTLEVKGIVQEREAKKRQKNVVTTRIKEGPRSTVGLIYNTHE